MPPLGDRRAVIREMKRSAAPLKRRQDNAYQQQQHSNATRRRIEVPDRQTLDGQPDRSPLQTGFVMPQRPFSYDASGYGVGLGRLRQRSDAFGCLRDQSGKP